MFVVLQEFVALQVVVNSQPDRKAFRGVSPALRSKRSEREELPLVRQVCSCRTAVSLVRAQTSMHDVSLCSQSLEEVELKRSRRSSADSTEMPPSKRRKMRGDEALMT